MPSIPLDELDATLVVIALEDVEVLALRLLDWADWLAPVLEVALPPPPVSPAVGFAMLRSADGATSSGSGWRRRARRRTSELALHGEAPGPLDGGDGCASAASSGMV